MSRPWYRWEDKALILLIRVQPGGYRDEIAGLHGQRLKVRLQAPAVEGKANAGLIRFLASVFEVARSSVRILAGTSSRDKRVRIDAPRCLPDSVESGRRATP